MLGSDPTHVLQVPLWRLRVEWMAGSERQKEEVPQPTVGGGGCGLRRILDVFEVEPKGPAGELNELRAAGIRADSVGRAQECELPQQVADTYFLEKFFMSIAFVFVRVWFGFNLFLFSEQHINLSGLFNHRYV